MSLRERILNREFEYVPNPLGLFDPLARERSKILEPVRRQLHNESPPITRFCYSESACIKNKNSFVSKILKALRKSGLRGYSLHTGHAFSLRYYGPSLQYEEEVSEEVFEIRNKDQGFRLQFRIVEKTNLGPAIHTLFLIRNAAKQGSFHAIKRMLVDEVWEQVLEPAGFSFLYGRAVWSKNSEICHACPRSRDWREELCYAGLEENLEPILIPGLRLFYYRLGFVQMRALESGTEPEFVALLSTAAEKKIKESIGENAWSEIRRFYVSEARRWRAIVAEREACLGEDELQRRIATQSVSGDLKSA